MIKKSKNTALILGILILSIFVFYKIDVALFNFINNIYLKNFFINITELGDSLWYFVLSLVSFLLSLFLLKITKNRHRENYKKLRIYSIFLFVIIFLSGLLTQILKHIVGRPRPNYAILENYQGFEFFNFNSSFHSFPSGHTSTIFVVAFFLSMLLPKIRFFFIVFASIVAFSRVAIGAHFLTDVIGGILVSYISFKITLMLFKKIDIKFSLSPINKLNSDLIFLSLFIFFIIALFLAIGDTLDIYLSSFFYLGDQQFILQSYYSIAIFFRKILLPLILLYLLVLPVISIFLPLKKIYLNLKLKTRDIFFIFSTVIFNLLFVINLLLKNTWGRARPNDVSQFGGNENFTAWFEFSQSCIKNCSFVSGDAAVGFSLIVLYLFTKNKIFFWISVTLGLSIGFIRILEGGHFFSDVVIAGLIIFLINYIQFYFYEKKYKNNVD